MLLNGKTQVVNRNYFLVFAVLVGSLVGLVAWQIESPAFLVMAGVVGLVGYLTLRNIEHGLVALLFVTYIRLSDVLIKFHGAPSVAKFIALALLGFVIIRYFLFNEKPAPWIRAAVLLTIYGLVGFASLLYANDTGRVVDALSNYGKDVVIALVVVLILQRREVLNWAVWSLLAAGIFLGTLSTYQFLTGAFDSNFWGFAQAEVRNIIGSTSDYRLSGPISSNFFALILVALIPFALDRFWHQKNGWLRLVAGYGLVVMSFSIFFTYSRGGFVALVIVLILMVAIRQPSLMSLLATGLIVVAMWQFVPQQYTARMMTVLNVFQDDIEAQDDGSIRGRYVETQAALEMFGDYPLRGVGLGNYNNNYLDYAEHFGLVNRTQERSAHSLYLEILAESGLIGFVAFGAIIAAVFNDLWMAYRKFKEIGLNNEALLTIAMGVSLLGYLAGSIFLHLAYARYFWLLIGLGFAFRNVAMFEARRRQAQPVEPLTS